MSRSAQDQQVIDQVQALDGFFNNDHVSLHQGRTMEDAETAQQSVACQIISTLCYGSPEPDEFDDFE